MKLYQRHMNRNFTFLAILVTALSIEGAGQATSSGQATPASKPAPSPGGVSLSVSPPQLPFKNQDIGTTTPAQAVTVKNSGNTTVTISISIAGNVADFRQTNSCDKPLKGGDLCVISVQFSPTNADVRDATLVISYQDPDSNTTASTEVKLSGHGDVPRLRVVPPHLDFGSLMVGSTSSVRTVTLTGNPDSEVQVTSVTASGDFAVTPSKCSLGLSGSCTLSVTFAPKQVGETEASLTIAAQVNKAPSMGSSAGGTSVGSTTATTGNSATTTSMVVMLTGEGTASCPNRPSFLSWKWLESVGAVLVVVLVFLLILMLIRWNMVAVPTRRLVESAIVFVQSRVEAVKLALPPPPPGLDNITKLLTQASTELTNSETGIHKWANYLFWTRGLEMRAWGYVHEAEEQLVSFLPPESVRAALERAESDLRQAGTPPASALADRIHDALVATPAIPVDRCREVIKQAANFLKLLTVNLSDRVCQMLDSPSSATIADYKTLLQDVASALEPTAATRLADQIDEALKEANPSVATLTPLLQQASKLLDPRAATALAAKIKATLDASPASADLWKPVLVEIRAYFKPPSAALAESIRQALAAEPNVPIGRWKALLYEALGFLYNRADNDFATLISWHNKAVYLVACGLLLIVSLAAALQHGVLFLVGATGGLLSRLTRALYRADVPTDYGASWTSLFLSPVVGALMGWAGILIVILAVEFKVLGDIFRVDWCNPYSPVALGLAFVLGFSERFFNGIMSQLEEKVQGKAAVSQPTQPTTLTITTSASLPPGKVGEKYDQKLAASGGTAPYKWARTAGQLPAGLNLDPSGQISGAPTAVGSSNFTLQVTDSASKTNSQEFTITVA